MNSKGERKWVNTSTSKSGAGIPSLDSPEFCRCPCTHCKSVLRDTAHWTNLQKDALHCDVKIGDRVLVNEKFTGVVKYVGDLDSSYTHDQLFVGVKLDDPVGEHDGAFNGRRLFKCPDLHGVVVPIESVHILVTTDGRSLVAKSMTRSLDKPSFSTDTKQTKTKQTNVQKATNSSSGHSSEGGLLGILSKSWARSRVSCTQSSPVESRTSAAVPEQDSSKANGDMLVVDLEETMPKETVAVQSSESKAEEVDEMASWDIPQESVTSMRTQSCHGSRPAQSMQPVTLTNRPHSCTPALGGSARFQEDIPQVTTTASMFSGPSQESFLAASTNLKWSIASSTATSPRAAEEQASNQSRGVTVGNPASSQRNAPTKETSECTEERDRLLTCDLIGQSDSKSCGRPCEPIVLTDATSLAVIAPPPPSPMESTCETTNHLEIEEGTIGGKVSFTNHLVSRLPKSDQVTPPDPTSQMSDIMEFGRVMNKWGGTVRAWGMAHTYQKLKDALQRGKEEIKWQKKIHELEQSGKYAAQIQRIRALQTRVKLNRRGRACVETKLKAVVKKQSDLFSEIDIVKAEIECQEAKCKDLCADILDYPPYSDAIEYMQDMAQQILESI